MPLLFYSKYTPQQDVNSIYEEKNGQVENKELFSSVKSSVNGFLAVLEEGAQPKERRQTNLQRSLSIHIEMKDDENNLKIGDVVSAKPPGEYIR